jgi:hypothetical protein
VFEAGSDLFEDAGDDGEALVGLAGYVRVVAADGTRAGDHDVAPDANSAGEADNGLEGRCAGKVLTCGHVCWMPAGCFSRRVFGWGEGAEAGV